MKSEERVDYEALKETGAFGFSNDGCGVQTAGTMYLAMKAAAEIDMPIVAHVEDNSFFVRRDECRQTCRRTWLARNFGNQ